MTTGFVAARSVEEAVSALAAGARPVAGGTDLVVGARSGKAPLPDRLVAIHAVDELRGIADANGGLRIGALATHGELAAHSLVRERYPALADACTIVGSVATRAQGTIGGNIMNASPAMEVGGPLIAFGARIGLRSPSVSRTVPLEELLVGPGRTAAAPDELLTEVELPGPAATTGSAYLRLEYRRQMEIAVVGATCLLVLDGGTVADARLAITALAPTIRRVPDGEAILAGTDAGPDVAARAAEAAAAAAQPIDDVRASARYRRAMTAVIMRRAIDAALARARGEAVAIPASDALYGAGAR
jgi:CO/xanthine dehydrogenase FAD-binding subunit